MLTSVLFGCATLVVSALLVWCYRTHARERRQLLRSRHDLAENREAERLHLARTLHDGPIQDLHALRMRLSLLGFSSDEGRPPPATAEVVAEVAAGIQEAILELRTVSETLRPPTLAPFGVGAALQAHADRLHEARPDLTFALDLDDDAQALPVPVRLALFRIAQEAVASAAEREARRINLILRMESERVFLDVCDDGTAPDDHEPALAVIHERAERLGALVHTGTEPSGQMRVRVLARRDAPEWRTLASPSL